VRFAGQFYRRRRRLLCVRDLGAPLRRIGSARLCDRRCHGEFILLVCDIVVLFVFVFCGIVEWMGS